MMKDGCGRKRLRVKAIQDKVVACGILVVHPDHHLQLDRVRKHGVEDHIDDRLGLECARRKDATVETLECCISTRKLLEFDKDFAVAAVGVDLKKDHFAVLVAAFLLKVTAKFCFPIRISCRFPEACQYYSRDTNAKLTLARCRRS